jgi:hypothetical protein
MSEYSNRTFCRTDTTGTFKTVYTISDEGYFICPDGETSVHVNLPKSFFLKGHVVALRIKVGHGETEMKPKEVTDEIKTMEIFKTISPELIGVQIIKLNGALGGYTVGYQIPDLRDVSTVFLIVLECDDMTLCLQTPGDLATKIQNLIELLVDNNCLFTDFKLNNLCCYRDELKMIDLDPKFYTQLVTTDDKYTYKIMMMLIFLMALYPETPQTQALAKTLFNTFFGTLKMHDLSYYIRGILIEVYSDNSDVQPTAPGEFNAFRMLCNYAYVGARDRGKGIEYLNLRKLTDIINIPFIIDLANQVTSRLLEYSKYTGGGRKLSKSRTRRSNKFNRTKRKLL